MSEAFPVHIHLKVITPQQLLLDEQVADVSLPGLDGDLGILPGHRPFLVVLGEGVLSFKRTGGLERIGVSGGYAEIKGDSVLVFTRLKDKNEQEFDAGRG